MARQPSARSVRRGSDLGVLRRSGILLIAAGLALSVPLVLAAASSASPGPLRAASESVGAGFVFTGTGLAYGLQVKAGNPDVVPLVPGGEGGVQTPTARSAAGTAGNGTGAAALVDPGDFVGGFLSPSTLGAMLPPGVLPPDQLPAGTPLRVSSDGTGSPVTESVGPGFTLRVVSEPGRSASEARGGVPGGFTTDNLAAVTTVGLTEGGGLTAVSGARVGAAGFTGLIDLGTVTTLASATRLPDGTLQREAKIAIKGASVAGFDLGIEDGRLVVDILGTKVPLDQAIETRTALAAVRDLGVRIALQESVRTETGIIAPALTVTVPVELPAVDLPAVDLPEPIVIPGLPVAVTGIGPIPPSTTTVTAVVGYAMAEAAAIEVPPLAPLVEADPGATVDSEVALPVDGGALVAPVGAAAPLTDLPVVTAPPIAENTAALGYRVRAPFDAVNIYLAIVVVALIASGAGQLARYQGVRTSWKS